MLAGALDLEHVITLARRELGLKGEVREADDCVHRRPDLVAHIGKEHALGFICLERSLGRLLQLLFRFLPRSDVGPGAHDLYGLSLLIAQKMLLVIHPAISAIFAPVAVFY